MKVTRRSVLSLVLIVSMIFSVAAFASCNNETEKVEDVTVHIKVIGSSDVIYDVDATVKAVPSERTILTAMIQFDEKLSGEPKFDYDAENNFVIQIGEDRLELEENDEEEDENASEPEEGLDGFDDEYEGEPENGLDGDGEPDDGEEPEETPDETEAPTELPTEEDTSYFVWNCYLNGNKAELNALVAAGDNIEFRWEIFVEDDE